MCAGGTGRHHTETRAFIAFQNGHMAGNHIDQRAGNKEGVDFARAAFLHRNTGGFNAGQAADTGADVHANAFFIQIRRIVQTRIGNRLQRRRNAVMDKHIHPARFFGADIFADIEIAYFAGNLAV